MRPRRRKAPVALESMGYIARPSSPKPVFAEDFSILVPKVRRMRGRWRGQFSTEVLH